MHCVILSLLPCLTVESNHLVIKQEEGYRTILLLFVGTLRPITKSLESWLQEGTLSDPSGEVFELCTHRNIARVLIEDDLFLRYSPSLPSYSSCLPSRCFRCCALKCLPPFDLFWPVSVTFVLVVYVL